MRNTSRSGAREAPSGPGRHTVVDPAIPRTFIKASISLVMVLSIACLYSAALVLPPLSAAAVASGSTDAVLYSEDFEDGEAQGWELPRDWLVETDSSGSNSLHLGGGRHVAARYLQDAWNMYSLSVRILVVRGRLHINYCVAGSSRYFIGIEESSLDLSRSFPDETSKSLISVPMKIRRNKWYEVSVSVSGSQIEVFIDGARKLSYKDSDPRTNGTIGFEALDGAEFYIDDIEISGQPTRTAGLRWVKTGGPIGGIGYDVRMRPGNPDVMYATDTFSGVSISTDGGRSWIAANDGIITRAGASGDAIPVFCLTVDKSNPEVIWCGTQNSRGIYKSLDGGKTWREMDTGVVEPEGISFRGFTVDPHDSDTVYAAAEIASYVWSPDGLPRTLEGSDMTKGVVYKTTDGGEHWVAIWRGDNLARYVWVSPGDSRVIYVSTGIFDRDAANMTGIGILKTIDGGRTWGALGAENGLLNLFVGSLYMHPQDPATLLAGTGNGHSSSYGVYLTSNGGETWQRVLATDVPVTAVEFAEGDPQVAYAATQNAVYQSMDSGRTWRKRTPDTEIGTWGPAGMRAGFPIDIQVDPRDPERLFVNNYTGGNFVSTDGGLTWVNASHGYTGAQMRDVAVVPGTTCAVYAIGRSGVHRCMDCGAAWEGRNYPEATMGEWRAVEVDPLDAERIIISDEHQGALLLSRNGGESWQVVFRHPAVDARDMSNRHGFKALAFSPSDTTVVYAGMCSQGESGLANPSYGVYKSSDGGVSWRSVNDGLTADQNINVLAVDSRDPQIVYAGSMRGGLLKTIDGGRSWQAMNKGLRLLDIRAIAIDPHDPSLVYVGVENAGIYKSSDGGSSWANVSSGMDSQAAIRAIVIDPTKPQTLYAADFRTGVYRSADGARTWEKVNDGLLMRDVTALAVSSDASMLYAATDGGGIFRLDLGAVGGSD